MKRICIVLALALLLTGCKTVYQIRPDTIVDIPLKPTGPEEETAEMTQPPTDGPTRPPAPEIPTNHGEPADGTGEDPTLPLSYDPGTYTTSGRDRAAAEAVNAVRREAGLAQLSLDARLCAIASVRAWEGSRCLSSLRPDGRAGISVLEEYGYGHTRAGEILCFSAGTAGDEVRRWMRVEETKAKILMDAEVIGVGCYTTPDGLTCMAVLIVG